MAGDNLRNRKSLACGLIDWFILTAGIVLIITALAKLISVFGTAPLLNRNDPATGLQFRHLLLMAAATEACVGFACFWKGNKRLRVALLAWISTCFLLYRCALRLLGQNHFCPCLGSLTASLHISSEMADSFMQYLLAYLFVGSCVSLCWLWRRRKTSPTIVSPKTPFVST